jgi:hypothetical protein
MKTQDSVFMWNHGQMPDVRYMYVPPKFSASLIQHTYIISTQSNRFLVFVHKSRIHTKILQTPRGVCCNLHSICGAIIVFHNHNNTLAYMCAAWVRCFVRHFVVYVAARFPMAAGDQFSLLPSVASFALDRPS